VIYSLFSFATRRPQAKEERYRRVFDELDLNANGSLDEHEIQAGLQKMGCCHQNQPAALALERNV
jgi:Ca2+-binding EF-hand superfamily protein